jgi:hypothetical protein
MLKNKLTVIFRMNLGSLGIDRNAETTQNKENEACQYLTLQARGRKSIGPRKSFEFSENISPRKKIIVKI